MASDDLSALSTEELLRRAADSIGLHSLGTYKPEYLIPELARRLAEAEKQTNYWREKWREWRDMCHKAEKRAGRIPVSFETTLKCPHCHNKTFVIMPAHFKDAEGD